MDAPATSAEAVATAAATAAAAAAAPTAASSPRFPGTPATVDGSGAVVWVEAHISEGACAYPITPSTPMGTSYQVEVANGRENLWGTPLAFLELESEHSSASSCEGFALAGGRVTNFTSGQGLVLMKEVLYTISGKRLPAVFHIGARALTSHSLNVHAGHDDVMAVADTGWGMLFARNAQEAADLALIARRAAEETQTPFFNVQDGFLTTHTLERVRLPEPDLMKEFVGDPRAKLKNLLDPDWPVMSGVVQNQDSYMKGKVAQRSWYDRVPGALEEAMSAFAAATGRAYRLVDAYRMEDAEWAFVGMGSLAETAQAVVDWLRAERGERVGCVHVTSFRPFPSVEIVRALAGVRAFSVLERMDAPLGQSNPLTAEIKAAFADAAMGLPGAPHVVRWPAIFSGIAGLGSRDIRPSDFVAMLENMRSETPRRLFVLGIDHPLALRSTVEPDARPPGAYAMRAHSVGGYGSVTTNKVIASVVSDLFDLEVQAYPKYGSEKKGLPTTSFLTVAHERVRTHCELERVDFVALTDACALEGGDPLAGLVQGGTVFLPSARGTPEEVWADLPLAARRQLRRRRARVLFLDMAGIARETATSGDLAQRMQGIVLLGVFLRSAPLVRERGLDLETLLAAVEKSLRKYFGRRGEQVMRDNLLAVRRGYLEVRELPEAAQADEADATTGGAPENGREEAGGSARAERRAPAAGGSCPEPTSCFLDEEAFLRDVVGGYNDGSGPADLPADDAIGRSLMPPGTAALRDMSHVAPALPELDAARCVGCMECVTECPDTAILAKVVEKPVLAAALAPVGASERAGLERRFARTTKYEGTYEKRGEAGGWFGLFVDPTKCKGCGECVTVCGNHGALRMAPKGNGLLAENRRAVEFYRSLPETPARFINEKLLSDLMLAERSILFVGGAGSCMGCGEATVLRMMTAATGFVHGPRSLGLVAATGCNTVFSSTYPYNPYLVPWTNSLFENAATVAMGVRQRWDQLGWQDKRLWAIGGDGAMYDIGFQALSRLLASGMDVKVLILDTQVYSNTGGQASTSTFLGQETRMSAFGTASQGKTERRKDMAQILFMHPEVYVAQTTPAHWNHFYKAILAANTYPGPAVIIAYAACQPEHGIADHLASQQARLAVDCRAFPLLTYDPRKGTSIRARLSLAGNPAEREDWTKHPKTGEELDFITFARTEGRFAKHFDKDGRPSATLFAAREDRLRNWHVLQELAGLARKEGVGAASAGACLKPA